MAARLESYGKQASGAGQGAYLLLDAAYRPQPHAARNILNALTCDDTRTCAFAFIVQRMPVSGLSGLQATDGSLSGRHRQRPRRLRSAARPGVSLTDPAAAVPYRVARMRCFISQLKASGRILL